MFKYHLLYTPKSSVMGRKRTVRVQNKGDPQIDTSLTRNKAITVACKSTMGAIVPQPPRSHDLALLPKRGTSLLPLSSTWDDPRTSYSPAECLAAPSKCFSETARSRQLSVLPLTSSPLEASISPKLLLSVSSAGLSALIPGSLCSRKEETRRERKKESQLENAVKCRGREGKEVILQTL